MAKNNDKQLKSLTTIRYNCLQVENQKTPTQQEGN